MGRPTRPRPIADPMDRTRFPVDEWRLVETRFESSDLGVDRVALHRRQRLPRPARQLEEGRDWHSTAPSSTASTRPGRSSTPRRRSGSPRSARRSSTRPTPRSSGCTSTTSRWRSRPRRPARLPPRARLPRRCARPRDHVAHPERQAGAGGPTRMVSFAQRHLAVMTFEVTLLDEAAPVAISSPAAQPPGQRERVRGAHHADGRGDGPPQGRAVQPPGAGAGVRPADADRPARRWATAAARAA